MTYFYQQRGYCAIKLQQDLERMPQVKRDDVINKQTRFLPTIP